MITSLHETRQTDRTELRPESKAQSGAQSEAILQAFDERPLSASELIEILELKSKTGAFKRTIKELLDREFIEYTIPDKPNSRLQKYPADRCRETVTGVYAEIVDG